MTVTNAAALPNDILIYLGRFLSLRTVQAFSSTCFHWWKHYSTLAQNELQRMHYPLLGINPMIVRDVIVIHLPLRNSTSLANHWWRFIPEQCRAIRAALKNDPLTYYVEFDPCRVLLEEDVLTARASDNSLVSLVEKEQDANRALILANQIIDEEAKGVAFRKLIRKLSELSLETALEIIQKIPFKSARDDAHSNLARRKNLNWITALEIIQKITGAYCWDLALSNLVARKEVPTETAGDIIKYIFDKSIRDQALRDLAKRKELPWKTAFEIIQTISGRYCRELALTDLVGRNEVPLETALEIIQNFIYVKIQNCALRDLAMRGDLLWKTAVEIIQKISDERMRDEALRNLAERAEILLVLL